MILITGASSGIGEATAREFAKKKQNLILVARRGERLKALAEELKKAHGVEVRCFSLDVSDREAVLSWAEKESKLLEQVTVLVNNAGLARGIAKIQDGDPENWDVMIDTNLKGLLYMTRVVLPHFLKRLQDQKRADEKPGHVVNIGSVAGRWAYAGGNVYSATKFAVSGLNQSMRLDLHGTGIRVTEIKPGMVETEFSLARFGDAEKAKAVYAGVDALRAEDVAEAIVWSVERPSRVNIQEIVLYPTDQATVGMVHRRP